MGIEIATEHGYLIQKWRRVMWERGGRGEMEEQRERERGKTWSTTMSMYVRMYVQAQDNIADIRER